MREEYDFSTAERGALIPEPGKTRITIRVDNDILEWFRGRVEGGGNYQTLMNHALRQYMDGLRLEEVVKKTIRESLEKAA